MSTKTKSGSVPMPSDVTGEIPPIGTSPIGTTTVETKALNFLEILNGMKSSSRLDDAAMKYIAEIDRIFQDSHERITSLPITTDKIEARVYIHEASRYAIILIFGETNQALDMCPPVERIPSLIDAVMARDASVKVLQSIVVTKEDYSRAGKMATFICNSFQTVSGGAAAGLSVENLKGLRITAITAIDKVRNYVRDVSPHAVSDRDDIGVLLCLEIPSRNNGSFQREIELKPFLAITGYTRVMNPQDAVTGSRFVPIPTITNVISSIPNASLLAMALPMAADAFILQNLWIRPYTTFRTGSPNLGNLITDPVSKKPLFTDTNETFHSFLNQYMTPPFLAIDITEGRARPLGLDELINAPDRILNNIRNFFKSPTLDFGVRKGQLMVFTNYTGSYVDNGVLKDTRYVDYLELACKVSDHKQIEDLLLQPNQPQIRIERVRSIYPENTKSWYSTTTVVLDANAISMMSKALHDNQISLKYDMPASGNLNLGQFVNAVGGNSFAGFQTIGYGFGPQSYVPGATNPYAHIFG